VGSGRRHLAKATTRAAANTSPEPFSNIGLSLAGDAIVPGALWLAWAEPVTFMVLLVLAVVAMLATTWLLWRFVRGLFSRIGLGARRPVSAGEPLEARR
jgi:hypothetical protein